MPDAPPIRAVIGLPPDETVRAFEARDSLRATVRWSEMWHEDHARAFTVAKVARLDMLAELQASIADMLANGGTFEQWRAGIEPYLRKQGWWGEVTDASLTGTDEVVHVGPRRLRTIYDTNLRVSRAAGRWARIQELKGERPFLRYVAVQDARTRPEHRAWHGTILPVDHEWWNTHFPPCGWYCRCTVRQLSQRELDARGWAVAAVPPAGQLRLFQPAGRGTPVAVPAGIDPGFDYNPGRASMGAIAERAAVSASRLAETDLTGARAIVSELVASDAFDAAFAQKSTFPMAVLELAQAAAMEATSSVLVFPAGIQRKQLKHHPEVRLDAYRHLPAVIHDPLVVIAQSGRRLIFYAEARGQLWKTVVRQESENALFPAIVSFHITGAADLRREARKGEMLLDRRS